MTFKDELRALVNAHFPKHLWGNARKAKYVLRFSIPLSKFDLKMVRKLRATHGVSKFYIRKRKNETVLMFIFSERFFNDKNLKCPKCGGEVVDFGEHDDWGYFRMNRTNAMVFIPENILKPAEIVI